MYDKAGELFRIDRYWSHDLGIKSASGELKCPHLRKVVLTCLYQPHGNADVERSISINKKLLTPERSLFIRRLSKWIKINQGCNLYI